MRIIKIFALLVVMGCVAVFTFQNTAVVDVRFLFWTLSMSVSLMLLATLFTGIIIGLILSLFTSRRQPKKISEPGMFDE